MIFKITTSEIYLRKKIRSFSWNFENFLDGKAIFSRTSLKGCIFIKDTLDNKIMKIDTELVFKLPPEDVFPIDMMKQDETF